MPDSAVMNSDSLEIDARGHFCFDRGANMIYDFFLYTVDNNTATIEVLDDVINMFG